MVNVTAEPGSTSLYIAGACDVTTPTSAGSLTTSSNVEVTVSP